MTEPPILTVAIPTYNRSAYVTTAIESLRGQTNVSKRWRVVVVDNNSSDDTAVRVRDQAAAWPRLAYVREDKQGLSHARNRALAMCAGGWLLFADDEAKFPADYVDRALGIIDTRAPVVFGGPIYPWYPQAPPGWWLDEYGSFSLPWSASTGSRIYLSGGNMGFEVAALRSIGGFDPGLGMRGGAIRFGEETAVELALVARYGGDRIWFDPEFFNFHAVRPEKFSWLHMVREHFMRGMARGEVQSRAALAEVGAVVPECLRARPRPAETVARSATWRARAMRLGLGVVRRVGLGWFRLSSRRG